MKISINGTELDISNRLITAVIIISLLLGGAGWRYYSLLNYNWSGIYASQDCHHVKEDDFDHVSDCIIAINRAPYPHNFFISSTSRTKVYRASGNLFGRYLYQLSSGNHQGIISVLRSRPNPDKNPQNVLESASADGHPDVITHQNRTYHRMTSADGLERWDNGDVMPPRSLYDSLFDHTIWQTQDGAILVLQQATGGMCFLPAEFCPELILTQGDYSQSLLIGNLKLISEDAYHGTLTMQSNRCQKWDSATSTNKTVGREETFVFGFDVSNPLRPQLNTLDVSIQGKIHRYQLHQAADQQLNHTNLGFDGLNIQQYQADKDRVQSQGIHHDGCNLWQLPL